MWSIVGAPGRCSARPIPGASLTNLPSILTVLEAKPNVPAVTYPLQHIIELVGTAMRSARKRGLKLA